MKKIIFALVILLGVSKIFAQDTIKPKKLMPRPPIYGIPAKTLPKGKTIYRSYFTFSDYTMMYNTEKKQMIDLPQGMSFQAFSYTPKLRYGLTNNLTLIANFPLYYKTLQSYSGDKTGYGLGDIQTALLYKFYHNKQKKFLVSGLLYSKLPTGKSTNLGMAELPLGTGSFDAGVALMPEKEIGKFDIRLSAFYIYRSKNKTGVDLGDVQMYSFSTAYNFSKKLIAEGTILYKSIANNSKNGTTITNSYVKISQVILGAQYRLATRFLVQAAVPVTLYAKAPFSSDYDVWLGIYYLW